MCVPETRSFWREPVIVVCTTLVIVCMITGVTVLIALGRTMDLSTAVRTVTPLLVSLITFLGTMSKVRTVEKRVENVPNAIANGNGETTKP